MYDLCATSTFSGCNFYSVKSIVFHSLKLVLIVLLLCIFIYNFALESDLKSVISFKNRSEKVESHVDSIKFYVRQTISHQTNSPPLPTFNSDVSQSLIASSLSNISKLKSLDNSFYSSYEGAKAINTLENNIRNYLASKYGNWPLYVEILLEFPAAMASSDNSNISNMLKPLINKYSNSNHKSQNGGYGRLVVELGPLTLIPYSVYFFLNDVYEPFQVRHLMLIR